MQHYAVSIGYPASRTIAKAAKALAYYTARYNNDQEFEYTNFMHNKIPYTLLFIPTSFGFSVRMRGAENVVIGQVYIIEN